MTWAEELRRRWDLEDRRAHAGATPCCGRRDFVVLYEENGLARVQCRACQLPSTIKV